MQFDYKISISDFMAGNYIKSNLDYFI